MAALSQGITELFPLPSFAITRFRKHIPGSINRNLMKLDRLREGNKSKSIVQEPKPFHKILCSYFPSYFS